MLFNMFYSLVLFLLMVRSVSNYEFLLNVSGTVTKGNFTYFGMTYQGTILLELISSSGDCDLYISQNTLKPSYEPELNCLQSTTCGLDTVIIPKDFKRPIGIGVFGHPSHEICEFQLHCYRIQDSQDIFNYYPHNESVQMYINNKIKEEPAETEESFLWVFLRTFLTCLIEIII